MLLRRGYLIQRPLRCNLWVPQHLADQRPTISFRITFQYYVPRKFHECTDEFLTTNEDLYQPDSFGQ
jgi:hypothetical protein